MKRITTLKAFALSLTMVLGMLLPMTTNAQSDGFFRGGSDNYDNRDSGMELGGSTAENPTPVGSGLLVLTIAGACYVAWKRKRSLNLLLASAMLLTFTQCKKKEIASVSNNGVHITLNAGYDNSKTSFYPATGAFTWTGTVGSPEYINVGGSINGYLGQLESTQSGSTATFSGTITPSDGETLYFFYLGKGNHASATSVDFSNQDGTLENVTNYHIAISNGIVYNGQTSFSTTLNMKMAIAYFDVNGFKNASETAETVYLHGDEVYSTATIDYRKGTIAGSTKGNISLGTATAEKYVALIPSVSTETRLKFDSDSKTGAMTFLRGIQAGKYYANSDAALSVAANNPMDEGALPGFYSVSATKKVRFSKGNLQYTKSTNLWSFMEHQYDVVETLNQWVGNDYADQNIVSLFCYGTSGYNYGATVYQPWSTTNRYADCCGSNLYDINQADWGYNAIANGGNQVNSGWRTLSRDEWSYVFNTRTASTLNNVANARYAKAQVAGVQGVILFPDNYTHPNGVNLPTGINETGDTGWNGNNYTTDKFELMEVNGAVFLPAAGYRMGEPRVSNVGSDFQYWTSYYSRDNNGSKAASVNISSGGLDPSGTAFRSWGLSVRLVRNVD
ncbi:MAG: hypothetical protein K6A73_09055 [Bacteroidales bacterium]|nr:hypothetical protein [Bacteroidales bacterium]